jgi:hypothetical protein
MLSRTQKKVIRIAVRLKSLPALLRNDEASAVHLEPTGFQRRDAATQQLFTQTPAV